MNSVHTDRNVLAPSGRLVEVRGLVMAPEYHDGDLAFIDPEGEPDRGVDVVARPDDGSKVLRLLLVSDGSLYFVTLRGADAIWSDDVTIEGVALLSGRAR